MKLHTTTVGSGPRHIALVHGLGADGTTWKPLVDLALADGGYTITTVDLRGHGESPRAESYDLADFASDLVENLPEGLDDIVSHSLGGAVVVQAVERLRPRRTLYLDPGFRIGLPTTGVRAKLLWGMPFLVPIAFVLGVSKAAKPRLSPENEALLRAAQSRWHRGMLTRVLRSVAFSTRPAGTSATPSVVLLSDDAPAVVPDPLPAELAADGWDVRRIRGIGHVLYLENARRVYDAIRDVL